MARHKYLAFESTVNHSIDMFLVIIPKYKNTRYISKRMIILQG